MIELPSNLLTQSGTDDFYDSLVPEVDPLPRLQLVTKGKWVDKGRIKSGHYALVENDEPTDLGPSIDILPLARRPKVFDSTTDPPTAVYDPDSPEFKRILECSQEKDSGCMWGVSFLVVVASRFCEFYCGNKSSRLIAPELAEFLPLTQADIAARNLDARSRKPKPVTLRSELVQQERCSWHVPIVAKCSKWSGKVPERISEEISRFVNP